LHGVKSIRVMVYAQAAATLSGAGTLRAWYYSSALAFWQRTPDLDLPVTVTAATSRGQVWQDIELLVDFGAGDRALWACDAVTASAGTQATVRAETGPFL
jgi:hypothetical protein